MVRPMNSSAELVCGSMTKDYAPLSSSHRPRELPRSFSGWSVSDFSMIRSSSKHRATNVRTPWHNDLPNWPVRGTQLITVWVALDTIGAGNGRLEFLRGSHRWDHWVSGLYADVDGRVTHFHVSDPETESQESLAADYAELLAQVDQHEILAWDTQPGDAVVFHALTIHGATGNAHSKNKRRAYSMRFAGPDVCYYAGPASNVGIKSNDLASGDPLSGEQYPVVYQA